MTAEEVKIVIGTVIPDGKLSMEVRGRDMSTGLPKEITISDYDFKNAIENSLNVLIDTLREVVQKTPPEILSDIVNSGVYLTGGGAYLRKLADYISSELKMPVIVPEDPMSLVAKGCGKILQNTDYFKEVLKDD
jgi:rod shape-determining protein MreB